MHEYAYAYIGLHAQPNCMRTHTLSMRAHAKSMRTHTRPNPNPNLENKNTIDRNFKSSNLACLKIEKLRKPRLKKTY